MDSMEFNKIAGGLIGAALLYLLLGFASSAIYGTEGFAEHTAEGEDGPVLAYAVAIEGAEAAGEAEEEPQVDLVAVFSQADAGAGESAFRACGACHALEQGVNRVGPTLHDVVGRDIAAIEGFAYSDVLAGMEGDWTPEALFHFLEDPKEYAPGTKMNYAGIDDPADRADLIAFLNESGGSPVDLTEGIEPLGTEVAAGSTLADQAAPLVSEADGGVAGAVPAGEQGAEAGGEVAGAEIVAVEEEDVEVESTTPLEIEEEVGPSTVPGAEEEAPVGSVAGGDGVAPAAAEVTEQEEQPAAEPEVAQTEPAEPEAAEPEAAEAGQVALGGDPAAGERLFRRCMACHTVEEGANRVGPHLAGVVGRDIASVEGFNYSDALAAHEGAWTPELLSAFIADPGAAVPGTKMAFAGLKDEQDRIDLITYLQQAAGD